MQSQFFNNPHLNHGASHFIGANTNTITIFPPTQYRNFQNLEVRPSMFNIDDSYAMTAKEAITNKTVAKDPRVLERLIGNTYTNGVYAPSINCDHIVDMTSVNGNWLFVLELYEQPIVPLQMYRNYATTIGNNAVNTFRVLYTGMFDQEPLNQLTGSVNPAATMIFLSRTQLASPALNNYSVPMSTSFRASNNLIIPKIYTGMTINTGQGERMFPNTVDQLSSSLAGVYTSGENNPLGQCGIGNSSAGMLSAYSLQATDSPIHIAKDASVPKTTIQKLLNGISNGVENHQRSTIAGMIPDPRQDASTHAAINAMGGPMGYPDYDATPPAFNTVMDDINRNINKNDTSNFILGINMHIANRFEDVCNNFKLAVNLIDVTAEYANGAMVPTMAQSRKKQWIAIMQSIIPPLLLKYDVMGVNFIYTSQRLQFQTVEYPTTGFKFEGNDCYFFIDKGISKSSVIDNFCDDLKKTVFTLLRQYIGDDFFASVSLDTFGTCRFGVEIVGTAMSNEFSEFPSILGGLSDPNISSKYTFEQNQNTLTALVSNITHDYDHRIDNMPPNIMPSQQSGMYPTQPFNQSMPMGLNHNHQGHTAPTSMPIGLNPAQDNVLANTPNTKPNKLVI